MKDKRQMIPAVGLLGTVGAAVYMVVQLNGQATAPSADFTNAAFAEVRDTQGLVVLSDQFQVTDEDDDDVERKAVLAPTGVDADATGVRRYAPIPHAIHEQRPSEASMQALERAVSAILEEQRRRAAKILSEQKGLVVALRDLLIERKVIDRAAFTDLLPESKRSKTAERSARKEGDHG